MAVFIVGGVNGVGKTYIFNKLKARYPHLEVVHTATALMHQLQLRPGDYATLRNLPEAYKNLETGRLISKLARASGRKTVVVDFHYHNLIRGEIRPTVLGDWLADVAGMVLVHASLEAICARICQDARDRQLFPPDCTLAFGKKQAMLAAFLHKTQEEFIRLSSVYRLPRKIIYNEMGQDCTRTLGEFMGLEVAARAAPQGLPQLTVG